MAGNSNAKTVQLSMAAQKLEKSLLLSFLIINISTIGFGFVRGKESTELVSTPLGTNETYLSFDINKRISMFSRQNDEIKKMIELSHNFTQTILKKYSENIKFLEKANTDLKKEVGEMRQKCDQYEKVFSETKKNISEINERISDMRAKQVVETENNKALENKVSASSIGPGFVIWKFGDVKSRFEKVLSSDETTYEGPIFYTCQFGYKMRIQYKLTKEGRCYIHIIILRGEYDGLLKWPFTGNITFIMFDQSEQRKNTVAVFTVPFGYLPCRKTWLQPTTGENEACGYQFGTLEEWKRMQFIKNDTLYIGVKVQSGSAVLN